MDELTDIAAYYDQNPQAEHDRLASHQLEWDLTWRYLDAYLPDRGAILEVGAASGRYTLELAKRGYNLTAVDLSAVLLEHCRRNLAQAGLERQVLLVVADARQLGALEKFDFEAVLLMGPLYHLVQQPDRRAALQQAYDRLQPGGLLFSAWISRLGVLSDLIAARPGWIEDQVEVRSVLAHGQRPQHYPRGGFRGYLALPAEIIPLHEAAGFETLALAAVEPVIAADDESYNRLPPSFQALWLDLLFEISREPSILGASRHLLYIGQKEG
jgi:SAM-dependent methyltransferase